MAIDYQTAYNQLGSIYDPQSNLVNQQIATIDPQAQAAKSSVEQAKVNAFRDIGNQANSKGILFSGFTPSEEARYTGEKYAPALAGIETNSQNQKFSLMGELNKIQQQRSQQAQGTVADSQRADAEMYKAQQDAAYKQAQLGLGYARLNQSGQALGLRAQTAAQAAAEKAANQYSLGYKTSYDNNGKAFNTGYMFKGPQGAPINLAQYVSGIGGGADQVLDILKNSASDYDRSIYSKAIQNIPAVLADQGRANYILNKVKQLDTGHYYGL